MLITLRGRPPASNPETGTVGLSKVVVMLYKGMGFKGLELLRISCALASIVSDLTTYVSALTSQITDRVRFGAERDCKSTKANANAKNEISQLSRRMDVCKEDTWNLGREVDAIHEDIRFM